MKVKLLEPIEGYEDVAVYRLPQTGDMYWNRQARSVTRASKSHDARCEWQLVLTPIKLWRPATIDDAVRAIKGETVVARFSDDGQEWLQGYLHGYRKDVAYQWESQTSEYRYCEVLDA